MAAPIIAATRVALKAAPASQFRHVKKVVRGSPTNDGMGVKLTRSIGSSVLPDLDPFLLLDEFNTHNYDDYKHGFPQHPHRGFETVTIMLEGKFRHKDSKGNEGLLVGGGVQWLTTGKGILHSEMPAQKEGHLWGLQLWVNLPAKDKMKEPRYQDVDPSAIPILETEEGVEVRLIAGEMAGIKGAIDGIAVQPNLLDVKVPAGQSFETNITDGHTLFLYGLEGETKLEDEFIVAPGQLAIFETHGDAFRASATDTKTRFLVVSGAPINEPIARYGPFVMNTHSEILQTLKDFKSGNY